MEVTLEQLNHFTLPLKSLEIAFLEALKLKLFRGSMPPDSPRGYHIRRAFIRTPLRQTLDLPQITQ